MHFVPLHWRPEHGLETVVDNQGAFGGAAQAGGTAEVLAFRSISRACRDGPVKGDGRVPNGGDSMCVWTLSVGRARPRRIVLAEPVVVGV